jgi:uncharacterized protein with FMN-binding domain
MPRIVLWALSTVATLVLLFSYHTSTSGVTTAAPPSSFVSGPKPGSTTATPSAPGATRTPHRRSTRAAHRRSHNAARRPSRRAGVVSPTPTVSPPTTVSGDVAQTQWGPVQVQLTVSNGQITRVSVPTYPNGNSTDAQINSYALPILMRETTAAQSARIDMVSGATVTSTGYLQSLQSAIDRAGL